MSAVDPEVASRASRHRLEAYLRSFDGQPLRWWQWRERQNRRLATRFLDDLTRRP